MSSRFQRDELAEALRRHREHVTPDDVGLPAGHARRTPGLRREEVALLAGVSVDYVVRMEQARSSRPSASVLAALAQALRLDTDGRNELFALAGTQPPPPGRIDRHVRPSVLRLMDRLGDLPTMLLSAGGDVLAWNAMSCALHGDWSRIPPRRRNLNRLRFLPDPLDPPMSRVVTPPGADRDTGVQVAQGLRHAAARYPDDPDLQRLISELRSGSAEFAAVWEAGGSATWRSHRKTLVHPQIGPLTLDCDTLLVPDTDQALVVYSAAPGTPEADTLALLRVVGTQDLTPADRDLRDGAPGMTQPR